MLAILLAAAVVSQPEILLQNGHYSPVNALAYSPDGKLLASGADKLKLWDAKTGQLLADVPDVPSRVLRIAFSPDGSQLAALTDDSLAVVDVAAQKLARKPLPGIHVFGWQPNNHLQVVVEGKEGVEIRDETAGQVVRRLPPNVGADFLSPNGHTVVGINNGDIKAYDLTTKTEKLLVSMGGNIDGASFSADGNWFFVTTRNGLKSKITLFDMQKQDYVGTLPTSPRGIEAMAVNRTGTTLGAACMDGVARFWDLKTRELLPLQLKSAEHKSQAIAFSPDGAQVSMGNEDNSITMWNEETGDLQRRLTNHSFQMDAVVYSPDGRRLVSAGENNRVRVWDAVTGALETSLLLRNKGVAALQFNADGSRLAVAHYSGVTVFDTKTWQQVALFDSKEAVSAAFSPDRTQLLIGDRQTGVISWDLRTKERGKAYDVYVNRLLFSPDGKLLMGVGKNTLKLVQWPSGKRAGEVKEFDDDDFEDRFAITPDWSTFVTAGYTTLQIWDFKTKKVKHRVAGYSKDRVAYGMAIRDGQVVILGYDRIVRTIDLATGKQIREVSLDGRFGQGLGLSPDGRQFAFASDDTTIKIAERLTGRLLVSLIGLDENDYMTITADNYYRASRGALPLVSFRVGTKVYPFEQFDLRYNRPDLVIERLQRAGPDVIAPYRHAYEKRLKRLHFTEEMLSGDFHLPEATFTTTINGDTAALSITAGDSKYQLDRLNVYVNDVPIYGVSGIDLRGKRSTQQTLQVPLSEGRNKIQVSVLNEKGVESLRETVLKIRKPTGAKPKLFVVSVGVSAYRNPEYALRYAAKDASDLTDALLKKQDRFSKVEVVRLLDGDATREKIAAARETLMRSSVDDEAIVFVAGHGLLDESLDYYFATVDIDFEKPATRGMTYDAIEGLLDGIPARRKVLLMDTCHSGEVDKSDVAQLPGNVVVAKDFRGLKRERRLSLADSSALLESSFADLRLGSGATVISSASGVEFALESATLKNGVFTSALLEVLRTDASPKVSEVRDQVTKRVMTLTNGLQHPTMRHENLENDFAIY